MSRFTRALRSTIGTKVVMALTGLGLLLFTIAHMVGNLQVFAGPEKLNAYAKTLQDLGPVLWAMRIGLLAIFVVHVGSAWRIWRMNRAARPERYAVYRPNTSSYASRTMMWSGLIVLAFIVYHLLHFTVGAVQPEYFHLPDWGEANAAAPDAHARNDVYRMVVLGFRSPVVALSYVVAQLLLGMHIWHGASSLFQTLGCVNPRIDLLKRAAGPALAVVIVVGNCAIPLAVLLNLVGSDVRQP
jgi:succinate dehydrogenase / fumarate reductase, cytochrome b subunit